MPMLIRDHAIKKYKKRIGKRTASKSRIISAINHDIKHDLKERKPSNEYGCHTLITSKFQAICKGNTVLTIKRLNSNPNVIDYRQKRKDVENVVHL